MKWLILIVLLSGCAVKVGPHAFRVQRRVEYVFKYNGVFISDEALSNMMGDYFDKRNQGIPGRGYGMDSGQRSERVRFELPAD